MEQLLSKTKINKFLTKIEINKFLSKSKSNQFFTKNRAVQFFAYNNKILIFIQIKFINTYDILQYIIRKSRYRKWEYLNRRTKNI